MLTLFKFTGLPRSFHSLAVTCFLQSSSLRGAHNISDEAIQEKPQLTMNTICYPIILRTTLITRVSLLIGLLEP
jgi:hypothetical protein